MQKLLTLLSQEEISNYEIWFSQIAEELFFKTVLKINNIPFSFQEIEFYVNDVKHPDPFTHQQVDQKKSGTFYFHKRGKTFQEGKIKGLDITCGNLNRFGGILIRGIKNLDTHEYIDGPGNVVQSILDTFGIVKVRELVSPNDTLSICEGKIFIESSSKLSNSDLIWTPRVGLTLNKQLENRIPYLTKEYRVLRLPIETQKGLKWIDAAAILNGVNINRKSRGGDLVKLTSIIEQGSQISDLKDLSLTSDSNESEYFKLYGFYKKMI